MSELRSIERRYLVLLGLRWLPVALVLPLLVLILSDELGLAQVGVLAGLYSATVVVLELPTGGLADSLGRRPVLLASSVAAAGAFAGFLLSSGFAILAVAMMLLGVSRALDSGPLEAWFVDESKNLDPDMDLTSGLARGGTVDGIVSALGAVIGGFLPHLFGGRLRVAVVAALIAQVVHGAAVAVLMRERAGSGARSGSVREALATTPTALRDGARLAAQPGFVQKLLIGAVTIGVAIASVELLWQPQFSELWGSGTGFLGVLLAVAFAGGAVGAALAPRLATLTRRFGAGAGAVTGQAIGALALVVLAISGHWLIAGVAFVIFYAANGAAGPLRDGLLHERVPSETRATMLSADSLAFQIGGFVSSFVLAAIAERNGIPLAWIIAAIVLALGALLYRRADDRPST